LAGATRTRTNASVISLAIARRLGATEAAVGGRRQPYGVRLEFVWSRDGVCARVVLEVIVSQFGAGSRTGVKPMHGGVCARAGGGYCVAMEHDPDGLRAFLILLTVAAHLNRFDSAALYTHCRCVRKWQGQGMDS
jgi:hypothetical protein